MAKIIQRVLLPLIRLRAKRIAEEILPCIGDAATILDFGCGDMMISKYLSEKLGGKVRITGLDVVDYNLTDMDFILYDGKKIPFGSGEFDAVIAVFSLHHTENPEEMLRECIRVAGSKVILIEDVYWDRIGKGITMVADWVVNHLESLSVDIPFNFLSLGGWKGEFLKNRVQLSRMKRIYSVPFWPTRSILFELRK
jgi:SAM-dependent methyltransferase